MGRNFDDHPDFQPKIAFYAQNCTFRVDLSTYPLFLTKHLVIHSGFGREFTTYITLEAFFMVYFRNLTAFLWLALFYL